MERDGKGRWIKARVNPPRMGLGVAAGGAVRLGPAAEKIAVCEGVETGLAIAQACDRLTVWAALSTGGMRSIRLPEIVRQAVVCADHDNNQLGKRGSAVGAGEDAALALCARLEADGVAARIAMPGRAGMDWNDVLRAA